MRLKLHNSKYSKQNGLLLNLETDPQELNVLSYATACLHPSVSLNNEKNHEISEDKRTVCIGNRMGPSKIKV